jgi:Family of unknown function (DUF6580)
VSSGPDSHPGFTPMTHPRVWLLSAMVLGAAASRVVPHPPNFAPMTAVALFGAATFSNRRLAVLVPLGSLLLGDLLLHLTFLAGWQPHWGFYRGQWVVYACLLPTILFGLSIRRRRTVATVTAATLASSLVFFLATNFVWAYGSGSIYPRTVQGLFLCYEMAIPFFGNSLAGDAVYSTVLFGALAMAEARFPALRFRKTAPEVAARPVS